MIKHDSSQERFGRKSFIESWIVMLIFICFTCFYLIYLSNCLQSISSFWCTFQPLHISSFWFTCQPLHIPSPIAAITSNGPLLGSQDTSMISDDGNAVILKTTESWSFANLLASTFNNPRKSLFKKHLTDFLSISSRPHSMIREHSMILNIG